MFIVRSYLRKHLCTSVVRAAEYKFEKKKDNRTANLWLS